MTIPSLHNEADIIASLPAIFGYAVRNSVVILILSAKTGSTTALHCGLRLDVATTTVADVAELPSRAAQQIVPGNAAILIAVVDDPQLREHVANLIDATSAALTGAGVAIQRRLIASTTAGRGTWMDLDTFDNGQTYSYRDSAIAAERVYRGSSIATSREAIDAEFDPAEPSGTVETPDSASPLTAADAAADIAAVVADEITMPDDLPAKVASIITTSVHLRDAMLVAGISAPAQAADVWTRMAARMRGDARAQALSVAAALYYAHGDGVRAGIALDVATTTARDASTPVPQLSVLLDAALREGITPAQLREVFATVTPKVVNAE
jgi:hypothetical protein